MRVASREPEELVSDGGNGGDDGLLAILWALHTVGVVVRVVDVEPVWHYVSYLQGPNLAGAEPGNGREPSH